MKNSALKDAKPDEQIHTKVTVRYEDEELPIEDVLVTIDKKLNEHTVAKIKGRVKQSILDKFVLATNTSTNLQIEYEIGKDNILLFSGVIVKVEAESEGIEQNAVYYLEFEAYSYTYLMDIQYKKRSFQDVHMTYDQLIRKIIQDYPQSDYLNNVGGTETLNSLTMQYQETDWQFLKRIASKFYAPLIANHSFKSPKFSFGLNPDGSSVSVLDNLNYKLIQNVDVFRSNVHNYRVGIRETDYLFYEVTTDGGDRKSLEIGDAVQYKGRTLYVISAKAKIRHHILSHTYTLAATNGFFIPPIFNETIAGLTIQGTVIKVSRNLLKVRLDIDPKQSVETAYWFKYSTFYATWYCMPEVGDRVNVHFATKDESDAVVINSIKHSSGSGFKRDESTGSNSKSAANSSSTSASVNVSSSGMGGSPNFDFDSLSGNEKVKMIVTSGGKMVILDDSNSSVSIVCNDNTFIKLTDSDGISIFTDADITFESKADISFTAEEMIYMNAKESIAMECGESLIELTPEEIKVRAADIKMNK